MQGWDYSSLNPTLKSWVMKSVDSRLLLDRTQFPFLPLSKVETVPRTEK